MKSSIKLSLILVLCAAGALLTGCLFKSARVSTRHFVLSPISTNEPAPPGTANLPIGISPVKMPYYLLPDSLALRHSATEIDYLEDALWGERLDKSLQQTIAANLSKLLPTDSVYLSDWPSDQVKAKIFVTVQQFDVDDKGLGIMIARWRITTSAAGPVTKSGQVHLTHSGQPTVGKPQAIANTLSELTADFSRELVKAIRESTAASP